MKKQQRILIVEVYIIQALVVFGVLFLVFYTLV